MENIDMGLILFWQLSINFEMQSSIPCIVFLQKHMQSLSKPHNEINHI